MLAGAMLTGTVCWCNDNIVFIPLGMLAGFSVALPASRDSDLLLMLYK